MKVAIVNYGMGNIGSVRRALEDLGADVFIAEHPSALSDANRIILPGVGAFSEGMGRLSDGGWCSVIHRLVKIERKPILGLCLGMQMLAQEGDEGGIAPGLGLIAGRVRHLESFGCVLRIPHMGWNDVAFHEGEQLFAHIPQGSDFYFVHSYAFQVENSREIAASTTYGVQIAASVRSGNVFGTQFHPEKSSRAGRQLLRNFMDLTPC